MNISKAQRIELNTLSKTLFGSSSRWEKLMDKGYDELVTEEVDETVPSEKEGDQPTVRKVRVPGLSASGAQQYVRKYYTVDSVIVLMNEQKILLNKLLEDRKELIEKIMAEQAARKEQEEAKALAKKVHSGASGSATL